MVTSQVAQSLSGAYVSVVGGYLDSNVSGQVIANLVSGSCILHSVVIGQAVSGGCFAIWDSMSGTVGMIESQVYAGSALGMPQTLVYDMSMQSGIVIVTSGNSWNITVTYR
jgi:hypothetical protein